MSAPAIHPSATIHPTAVVGGAVTIEADVEIGPHCTIDGSVSIGRGTRLIGHVWLQGPLRLGTDNQLHPFVALGQPPQDLKWDPRVPGAGIVVGDRNVFREGVTVNRATSHDEPTRIGDDNFWMGNSHLGHDGVVGNHCIFANGTLLAGHVRIGDRVVTGGNATIHQFVTVGRGVMFSGLVGVGKDIPPFFMVTGINQTGAVNLIGMRRAGLDSASIDDVRWCHKILCRSNLTVARAVEVLRERGDRPLVREIREFVESAKRGICLAYPKPIRGATEPKDASELPDPSRAGDASPSARAAPSVSTEGGARDSGSGERR